MFHYSKKTLTEIKFEQNGLFRFGPNRRSLTFGKFNVLVRVCTCAHSTWADYEKLLISALPMHEYVVVHRKKIFDGSIK